MKHQVEADGLLAVVAVGDDQSIRLDAAVHARAIGAHEPALLRRPRRFVRSEFLRPRQAAVERGERVGDVTLRVELLVGVAQDPIGGLVIDLHVGQQRGVRILRSELFQCRRQLVRLGADLLFLGVGGLIRRRRLA
ncbi:MAG: hypothetical protein HZA91_05940 [Verrucomicrobia bacterium]|nr:hypothetical protein [Verrucomicrobiota bacterium]